LSHYLYDIRDEWGAGCVNLQPPTPPTVCLMENYPDSSHTCWVTAGGTTRVIPPAVTNAINGPTNDFIGDWKNHPLQCVLQPGVLAHFCWDGVVAGGIVVAVGNHKVGTGTAQDLTFPGKSCWTVMVDDSKHDNIPYGLHYPTATPAAAFAAAPTVL